MRCRVTIQNVEMEICLSFLKIGMAFHAHIKLSGGMLGCAVFTKLFYSLQSESKQIWTLFASYSHNSLHITFKILAQIRIQIFDLMQKIHVATNIPFRANIPLRFSHTGEYLQNFKRSFTFK